MQFASLHYWYFLLITITLLWSGVRVQTRWYRNCLLLLASYFFYGYVSTDALILLIFSTTVNHICSEGLLSANSNKRSAWLWAGIGFNIGLLGVFKYLDFFRTSVESLTLTLGLSIHWPIIDLLLPVGISFYSFQAIAYLVDLSRGHGIRAKTLIDFALFQSFFPQLLIGPICRSVDLLPQIHAAPLQMFPHLNRAGWLIVSGLFKKIVVATLLFENGSLDVFSSPENYSAFGLWGGMFGYSIQLYCDFSGYTDLARGSALLLGFDIPDNFRQPYAATNLGDFWQRWHITFSQWLRDYIYIPLGGSKRSPNRVSFNLFITFLVCGLWHGASWGFIIWGGLHGIGLAIHKRNRDRKRRLGLDPKVLPTGWYFWTAWAWTFSFIAISRIFFVCPNLDVVVVFLERMVDPSATGLGSKVTLIYAIGLGWVMNFYGAEFFQALCQTTSKRSSLFQSFLLITCLFGLLILRPGGVAPYLYFQF